MIESAASYGYGSAYRPVAPAADQAMSQGIVRADGRVATRNYLAVIASVNCAATSPRPYRCQGWWIPWAPATVLQWA